MLNDKYLCFHSTGGGVKEMKKTRNKISTVYLTEQAASGQAGHHHQAHTGHQQPIKVGHGGTQLERSDSMVTVMGSTVRTAVSDTNSACKCQEVSKGLSIIVPFFFLLWMDQKYQCLSVK